MIEFFLPMKKIPTTTHQQKKITVKNSKPQVYEPERLKAAREKFLSLLAQHVPPNMYTEAVRLTVKWCFPRIKKSYDGQYKTTKPDTDNLQKLLKDCMTELGKMTLWLLARLLKSFGLTRWASISELRNWNELHRFF